MSLIFFLMVPFPLHGFSSRILGPRMSQFVLLLGGRWGWNVCPALGRGWNHPWKFNEPGEWLQCCAGSVLLCQPILPQCSGVQSCWALIQHFQRAAFIPSFFRNFCSFLNHWQGMRICSSGQGDAWIGMSEWNEILWFDKNV